MQSETGDIDARIRDSLKSWLANGRSARRPTALVLAMLGWAALALQFSLTLGTVTAQGRSERAAGILVLAGYFTILTNLLCAVLL